MKIPKLTFTQTVCVTILTCGYITLALMKSTASTISKHTSEKKEDKSVVKKTDDCVKPQQRKDSKQPQGGNKNTSGPSKGPRIVQKGGQPMLRRPKGGNPSKPKGK